ncbi:peptidase domain-containing ABC transporter [Lysinibacillus sp. NPDC094403]|uniref:peptidase domain-containing ABC transporter n=1 Tax=Lysinibacillus sp. NPDC094403 TaxID=3390581 RepID=UPI003D0595FC
MKKKKSVPFIEQLHPTECGLCCVAMILRYHKSYQPMYKLREISETGRDGLTLNQLHNLFLKMNFYSKAYRTSVDGLKKFNSPIILHWNNNHFVVLEKVKSRKFIIVDPAIGRITLGQEEFEKSFTGVILVPSPDESFSPYNKKEYAIKMLVPYILNNKMLFTMIFLISLLIYISTLALPILIQKLMDNVIYSNELDWIILLVFIGFIFLSALFLYIKGHYLIVIKAILESSIFKNIFNHILKVPYKFFETRAKGDILYRISSLDIVRDLLAENMIKGILDFGALIFMFSYLMYKSVPLTLVILILFSFYLLITIMIRPQIKELNLYEIVERSKLSKIQVETISSIFGIKVSAMEDQINNKYVNKLDDVLYRFKKQSRISNIYNTLNQLTLTISPLIVLVCGMNQFLKGTLTIGELLAFYSLTVIFFSTSSTFFQVWSTFWIASNNLERIKDITDIEIEDDIEVENSNPYPKLKGNIKLENINFSYTNQSNMVLKNINLNIKSGQKVAIVGESGSGKTTLGKILIGLYKANEGNILYDDTNIKYISKKHIRKQMGIVPQEIQLLNDSIYNNITMGNSNIGIDKVKKAAKFTQIAEEIENMPMGYNTLISDMGSNLSGGQRQRIALARSIINKHQIILLDEATSSLDSINEMKIANYLTSLGCTCIIIAHRLSTIKNSDIIYVLDKGEIIEQGTHFELMNLHGKYYDLYRSTDLETPDTF